MQSVSDMTPRSILRGLALASVLLLAACSGSDGDDVSSDDVSSEDAAAAAPDEDTTTTTTAATTTSEAPTTEEPSASTVPDEMTATQSSLAEQLAGADLDEIEAILATDTGRAAFIETILDIAPALTEDQAGCFLDEFDLTLLGALQENPAELDPEAITSVLTVLTVCEIPLTVFAGG